MVIHPSETLLRDIYAALMTHNLATLQLLLAPGLTCHLPARGDMHGFEAVFALWLELTQRSAHPLEPTLTEVLVGSRYAAALGTLSGGCALPARFVCLVRTEGGRVAECWLHSYDLEKVIAA